MNPEQKWHWSRGGEQFGPHDVEVVRRMIAAGQVGPRDLVWSDGMAEWLPAEQVREFFAPSEQAAAPVRYAGFWRRLAAMLLDGLVLSAIGVVINIVEGGSRVRLSELRTPGEIGNEIGLVLGEIMVAWFYAALQESSSAQATLGKRAMGLVVTNLKGKRIGFGRATRRHFGKFISALPLFAGFIMAAFTEKKQALHDRMAGTLVVRK